MKDKEINQAIRETIGCRCKGAGNANACNWNCPCGNGIMSGVCECKKDYVNDLNAMHEAEETLSENQGGEFEDRLETACQRDLLNEGGDHWLRFKVCHATARQRAEAFLRTVGKWRDQ